MRLERFIRVFGGEGPTVLLLSVILSFAIAGAVAVKQKWSIRHELSAELMLEKAATVGALLTARTPPAQSGAVSSGMDAVTAEYLHSNAQLDTSADPFKAQAVRALRTTPQHDTHLIVDDGPATRIRYAVIDARGGIYFLEIPFDREQRAIDLQLGQSFLANGLAGLVLIAMFTFGTVMIRRQILRLARVPQPERSPLIESSLANTTPRSRHNLLPWSLSACALVLLVDLAGSLQVLVNIGYVVAVSFSLLSSHTRHSAITAAVALLFLFVAPFVEPPTHHWWQYLQDHSITTVAIIAVVTFGSAHARKAQSESIAVAQAAVAQRESDDLRSALQRAEAAERRLERASLSSQEGHWEFDLLRDQVWLSGSFRKLLGFDTSAATRTLAEVRHEWIHPDDRQRQADAFNAHVEQGAPFALQMRYRNQDGSYRWYAVSGSAERDERGSIVRMAGSIRDIHEQKLAEDSLLEIRARFARAVRGTQDGFFDFDLITRKVWVSPRLWELVGYDADEMPTELDDYSPHVHPDDLQLLMEARRAHVEEGASYDLEYRLRTKSGGWLWVRSRGIAERDADGRAVRLSGSVQDITEARAAREALLAATAEAEAANRAKSTFLATMSHEIRTPMNGIIGMTGLMLDTPLDHTQRDYAETIRSSADSLLTVINDILDFSKIEAGKLDIERIQMDLRGTVEEVGNMMALQAAAKNLELIIDIRPEVPDYVMGDPQRIRQCLINLVGNAIKFTSVGEIVIEVSTLAQQDGRALTYFQVRDTGIGLAPATAAALFKPFVQADSSTTRRFGGTGLGLSIVKRLTEIMGGQVGVESTLGNGSSFWFTLPLEAVESSGLAARAGDLSGVRVLVVDDNATNLRVVAGQLARAGYECDTVTTGSDALHRMHAAVEQARPYGVVLIDYHMAEMDGEHLGERISGDPLLKDSRLVMLTSLDRSGDLKRFEDIGFAGYITKPVRARELLKCLQRVAAHDARDWHLRSQPIVTRASLSAGAGTASYRGKVLLAEDNLVNQKVAQKFVERLGCSVTIAGNGALALEAMQRERFDLVLMDMEMPVMDGLTATREIRKLENAGTSRTPVIALTANVMSEQVELCMQAGMDDYLAKPIDVERLQDVFDKYLGNQVARSEPRTTAAASAAQLDMRRLRDIADGDEEFMHELMNTFETSAAAILDAMLAALARGQRDELGKLAHQLKGASDNIGAQQLRDQAHQLEQTSATQPLETLATIVESIRANLDAVRTLLREPNRIAS